MLHASGRLLVICAVLAACRPEGREAVIVEPAWLRAHPEAVVVEAFWQASQRRERMIPGARGVSTDVFENGPPRWHLRPWPELRAAIGHSGIRASDTVVVYGEQTIAAARVWWILHHAGVRDVRYLNGGAAAWRQAGYPLVDAFRPAPPVVFEGVPRSAALATTEQVRTALTRGVTLADTRSLAEYRGETSGYDYLRFAGRIPRAIHLGDADDRAGIYQESGGRLKPLAEIERRWRAHGIRREEGGEIIFYCGSGWRSSLAFLYAHALGFPRIRNYSDGWSGWSTDFQRERDGQWRQTRSRNPIEPRP